MDYLLRESYLAQLRAVNRSPDIKVITGIRRCGKSVLLEEYAAYLAETEPAANVVKINLQELDYEELLDYRKLHAYALAQNQRGRRNVLLIDEVQLCPSFEKAINSLHAKRLYDIYLTGSNAFLLSSDLATLFTGRTMEIKVFPFSFAEYRSYLAGQEEVQAAFDAYARLGGLPGSYAYPGEKERYAYVADVYRTILLRDLVQKYGIRNKEEFQSITEFMMDNMGNLLSPNNITTVLQQNKSPITRKTVAKYIEYLEHSFLFYEAKRFDLKGRNYLKSNSKYYLCDPAFRYAINGSRNMDFGRLYENIVYLELLRRGYTVYVGKLYQKEVDFVAVRHNEKLYLQVSDNIADEATFRGKCATMLSLKDAYPKIFVTRTRHEAYDYQGIAVWDLPRWLLGEE